MKKTESGNAIFYILIAVAMLAALSYTVAQSTRGGVGSLGTERAKLAASEIIEYGNILSQAVSQTILRGTAETEISFENVGVTGYANAACTEDQCKIFNVNGGGITYQAPKSEWLDGAYSVQTNYGALYFNGSTSVAEIGTAADDLVVLVPYLQKELCMAINDKLQIDPPSTDTPAEVSGPAAMNVKFTGTYDTVVDTQISGAGTTGNATILHGKMAGCTQSSGGGSNPSTGTYHYYQVLIAR